MTVNYGSPTRARRRDLPGGGYSVVVEHDGADNHDQLQTGEQCECGVIGLAEWERPE